MNYKVNTQEITLKSGEDLNLLHKCVKLMEHYAKHQQEEVAVTKKDCNGKDYTIVYPAGRVYRNFEKIAKVNGYSGYVVLTDNTIMCIDASDWTWQFDGCLESEMHMDIR